MYPCSPVVNQFVSGGWASLTREYNAGLFFDSTENCRGCAPSRAFRESLPCFAEAPSEVEGIAEGGPFPTADT